MEITVKAEWEKFSDLGLRIEIAGYTAAVEAVRTHHGATIFEFTVLQDHLRIVEVGQRAGRVEATIAAESAIAADIAKGQS